MGNGSTSYVLDSGLAVNDGNYHYVALIYNDVAKSYTLYLDNRTPVTQAVASNWTIAQNTDAVTLGYWPGYNNYFNGTIDQVQILSRPLSSTEVSSRYGNQLPTVSVTTPTNNATFTAPTSISLVASASDTGGSIAKVAFYQGNGSGSPTACSAAAATRPRGPTCPDGFRLLHDHGQGDRLIGAITISSAVNITAILV